MRTRRPLDRQPGLVPEIRADGESVTFQFHVTGIPDGAQLVIRCDANGDAWASIVTAPTSQTGTDFPKTL